MPVKLPKERCIKHAIPVRRKIQAALLRACHPLFRDMELELQALSSSFSLADILRADSKFKILARYLELSYETLLDWRERLRKKLPESEVRTCSS